MLTNTKVYASEEDFIAENPMPEYWCGHKPTVQWAAGMAYWDTTHKNEHVTKFSEYHLANLEFCYETGQVFKAEFAIVEAKKKK